MTYAAKDYAKLLGMAGFSETLLKNHFTLYQGYVTNTNKVLDTLAARLKDGKVTAPPSPEYSGDGGAATLPSLSIAARVSRSLLVLVTYPW